MRLLTGIEGIAVIRFDERDIVRHRLVKHIVRAYDEEEKTKNGDNK
jgi:phosphate starvation-inducible PhoH-like protein